MISRFGRTNGNRGSGEEMILPLSPGECFKFCKVRVSDRDNQQSQKEAEGLSADNGDGYRGTLFGSSPQADGDRN